MNEQENCCFNKEISVARSRSRYLPEECEFRNGYVYNNNMLSLAGEYIAAIAGTTLQNMVCRESLCVGAFITKAHLNMALSVTLSYVFVNEAL